MGLQYDNIGGGGKKQSPRVGGGRRRGRGTIPTFSWLAAKGFPLEVDYFWGCRVEENVEHLVTNCSSLAEVVCVLHSWSFQIPVFTSLEECLRFLARPDCGLLPIRSIFCMVIYSIWRARNDKRYGRSVASPRLIASMALAELPYLSLPPLSEQWCNHQSSRLTGSSHWCAPPPKWVKVNIDGALLSNHRAGVGMVIRDEFGNVLRVAGDQFLHWDSGGVEMEAFHLLVGLFQEWEFIQEGLIIEGDNLNVIQALKECWRLEKWKECSRLAEIFAVLLQFRSLLFSHVDRNCNRVADFCAHEAIRRGEKFCWDVIPPECGEIRGLLMADLVIVDPG